jgi:hypothetical protein
MLWGRGPHNRPIRRGRPPLAFFYGLSKAFWALNFIEVGT